MPLTIEKALGDRLFRSAVVHDLCDNRIYTTHVPQSAKLPYIVLNLISEPHEQHMTGAAGWANPAIQVDIFTRNLSDEARLSEGVRLALLAFDGTVSVGGETLRVRHMNLRNRFRASDFENASDTVTYRTMHEYEAWHPEAIPA